MLGSWSDVMHKMPIIWTTKRKFYSEQVISSFCDLAAVPCVIGQTIEPHSYRKLCIFWLMKITDFARMEMVLMLMLTGDINAGYTWFLLASHGLVDDLALVVNKNPNSVRPVVHRRRHVLTQDRHLQSIQIQTQNNTDWNFPRNKHVTVSKRALD